MKREEVDSLFRLARIPVLCAWEMANQYWPRAIPADWTNQSDVAAYLHYAKLREASPWWLVKTHVGLILIGWRKRVIHIDWMDTTIRATVTQDDVTKSPSMVHAWTTLKALEYLTALGEEIDKVPMAEPVHAT